MGIGLALLESSQLDEECRHLSDGKSESLMGERESRDVEIAGREEALMVGVDQRAVGGGIELDLDMLHGARERIMRGPVYLGDATKRQRILDASRCAVRRKAAAVERLQQSRNVCAGLDRLNLTVDGEPDHLETPRTRG